MVCTETGCHQPSHVYVDKHRPTSPQRSTLIKPFSCISGLGWVSDSCTCFLHYLFNNNANDQRHSVSTQWVPPHVGAERRERTDEGAVRGSVRAFQQLKNSTEVRDIWQELGLGEMTDFSEDRLSGKS